MGVNPPLPHLAGRGAYPLGISTGFQVSLVRPEKGLTPLSQRHSLLHEGPKNRMKLGRLLASCRDQMLGAGVARA